MQVLLYVTSNSSFTSRSIVTTHPTSAAIASSAIWSSQPNSAFAVACRFRLRRFHLRRAVLALPSARRHSTSADCHAMPLSPSLSPSPSPKTVPPESTAPASTSTPPQAIPATRPTLLKFADGQESGRRPSVQFLSHNTAGLPTGSPKATRIGGRRMSSPPPPP